MDVLIRILLRYLAMFLVAKGFFSPELGDLFASDPDILSIAQVVVGLVAGLVAEGWYVIAKRFGWRT